MAKRTSNIALQVEQVDASNKRRTSNVALMVEQRDANNMRRTSSVALMVEYQVVPVTAQPNGPKLWVMGD